MAQAGHRRILVLATGPYAGYSGCRQYRENLFDATEQLRTEGWPELQIDKLRHFYNHPGFVGPMVDATLAALEGLPRGAHLVFTTHSIPTAVAETSGMPGDPARGRPGGLYLAQHLEVADLIADAVAKATGVTDRPWELVYQSRSGAPHVPWLEPDVCDHLQALHDAGAPAAAIVPIGFVSDHMEVAYDLDTAARAKAAELGLPVARAATVGADPRFAAAVRELVLERAATERGERPERRASGRLGPSHDVCQADCCPNPRGPRPALAQT
jgi:ferrochelatase